MPTASEAMPRPSVVPVGDSALLVRFGTALDYLANQQTLAFAAALMADPVAGVVEVVPSLVSVLLRYDASQIGPVRLAGEISLRLAAPVMPEANMRRIPAIFGGDHGPDLEAVAEGLGLSAAEFVAQHCAIPLRVLAGGFAPGFVYCGFHPQHLVVPRRASVRPLVPAGSVLFAAGQTAVTATDIPSGWHVIGRTEFSNFDAARTPPTTVEAGDFVQFEAL